MKVNTFKDSENQAQFERDGYIIIDFISPEETKAIADKFYELHPVLPKGFYSNAYFLEDQIRQDIFSHTDKVFKKALNGKFQDYKKLGSTFLCKSPGEEGKMGVHQDWTVVDESKFFSATIWVPTIDVNEENGALRVIPGSHLFFDTYRSPNIDFRYKGNEELLWANMITVPMKAGQAFVLNHAVIHGSSSNKTKKERLAIAYGIAPKQANLIFYHKDKRGGGDKVEKFEMPDDFFQRYNNFSERPLFGNMVKIFEYPVPLASDMKIGQLIEQEKRKRNLLPEFQDWIRNDYIQSELGVKLQPKVGLEKRSFLERYSLLNMVKEVKKNLF